MGAEKIESEPKESRNGPGPIKFTLAQIWISQFLETAV